MPIVPNALERLVLLRLNRGPGPVLDLLGAASYRAVVVGIELGVFETLGHRSRPVEAVATELDVDPDALEVLLSFLARSGYVERVGRGYRTTRMTRAWLLEDGVSDWLAFWSELVFPFWDEFLEGTLRRGAPPTTIYEWFDESPDRWRIAQRGFRGAARPIAGTVPGIVSVPDGARRLLDVGGGHGLYSVEFCRRHPDLRATVLDVPEARDAAAETVEAAGMEDRISFRPGDYLRDELGSGYDVALLCNVLHAHDPREARRLLRRTAGVLEPGGRLVVLDQFEGTASNGLGATTLAFVALTYLVTLGASLPRRDTVLEWLSAIGLEDVEWRAPRRLPGVGVLVASKPA